MGRGAFSLLLRAFGASVVALAFLVPAGTAATVQPNFQETTVFSGLSNPTTMRFAPDGRVFVAEKSGVVKTFDSLNDGTSTTTINLATNTYNFWDRGMLGMAIDPNYPAEPFVYVLYTYDASIGGLAPRWGTPGVLSDPCPTPPGATGDGCVVSGRLSRFTVGTNGVANGSEQVLIEDWCQQYPSHSIGQLAFGSDGALYVSGGDGASFNFTDWGQDGNPVNPCGDPPGPPGTALSPPTAQGGALRSQDLRTTADPTSLDGTVLRVDKNTGAAFPGNPLGFSSDPNARRIVAHGLRNPFRLTVRPGTNDVWVGDVGWNNWEEVNHLGPVADLTVDNFGWPCYEGNGRQSGYDGANLNVCENLYTAGAGAHRLPHYTYSHSAPVVNGETCPTGGSSAAGMTFYNGGNYPSKYLGALFFSDYSRRCIWAMLPDGTGLPDPNNRETFVASASGPVDLQTGPGGDLFYVDFDGGSIKRIRFLGSNTAPVAQMSATPQSGPVPLDVSFSGSASTDAEGQPLSYTWDLNGDGTYGDATGVSVNHTYTVSGTYTARLRVTDSQGASDTDERTIGANASSPPVATILSPTSSTNWQVGDTVNFSGTATDPETGTLPGSALSWSLLLHHCPSTCHTHPLQDFVATGAGSFVAPDHEYPSYLELRLTATDSSGVSDTETVLIQPQTVNLTFETAPTGLQVAVGGIQAPSPLTRTVIVGSANSVSAISPQSSVSRTYAFGSWSNGGAQTHTITAPAAATTYTATYVDTGPAPPEGLVAAYGFEEGTGTTTSDASANAHQGTLEGGTSWTTAGKYGRALFFDGVNDNVRIEDAPALDLTNGMTMSAWVKPQSLVNWNTVLMKENDATLSYALYGNTGSSVPSAEAHIGGSVRQAPGGGQIPLDAWSYLAATYDGAELKIFLNGAEVGVTGRAGGIATSTGPLRIGGNTIWPEWFHGYIDDVRVYERALAPAEIQADMNSPTIPPPPGDSEPPTAPTNVNATGSFGQVQLSWTAATDNVGVTHYNIHRSTVASFLPNQENRVAQVATTSHLDAPLAPGVYFYKVVAEDAAGLQGPPSNAASGTVPADSQAPTAPAGLTATVQGGNNVDLAWTASTDNVGVARYNVHRSTTAGFTPGTGNRIAQPTGASYTDSGLSPGTYYYAVTAQDAANNVSGSSNQATATIDGPPPPPPTLVAAYSFDEGAGTTVGDLSGNGNTGTVNGASWGVGRFGQALSFDGTNDRVTIPDSNSLDLTTGMTMEAWVRPTTLGTAWKTVLFKHRNANTTNMMYVLYANRNTSVPNAEITNGTAVRAANGTTQLPLNAWSHLAATYDGAILRLYVNATQVGTIATAGAIGVSTGDLWIGANNVWPEWFAGSIDEVRIFRTARTAGEIATDMNTSVGVPDTEPPTTPGNLQKTGSTATSISVSWTASTDNVGVAGYRVFRGTTEVGTTTNTNFTVGSLSCGSAHDISVEAYDFGNRASPRATVNASTSDCDTTNPVVSVTAPAAGAILSGSDVTLSASASDNDAVAGVQFLVDGAPLGAEDTTAPYSISWNTFTVSNNPYAITARARDASGNLQTSAPVNVTVNNTGPPPSPGLVAAYSFDEGTGNGASDLSGTGNHGTLVNGPTWTGGRFGKALSFDGVDDRVAIPDANSLDLTTGMTLEAWVRPSAAMGTTWRTVLFKHRNTNATNMMYVLYANRNTSVPVAEITNGTAVRAANGTAQVPAGTWTHLAATYDGAILRLFVNGAEASQFATGGSIAVSNGDLWIGSNNVWGERFSGLIDEIRVYNRPLTASEITTDMNRSVGVPDTEPPSTPGNLQKTGATATSISVSWTASTDNVGVAGYRVFRGTTEVGTTTNTNFTVGSLSCGSAHDISVEAYDFSENESTRAAINASTSDCDTTNPTVSVSEPTAGATVSGTTVNVAASASDNDAVAGVQFLLDGAPLGSEDTSAPYSTVWNSWNSVNGSHTLSARARDASGNTNTSAGVSVTVSNTGLPPSPGLVASYGFDEGAGTAAADSTGNGNHGALVNGPAWTIGRFGQALAFDGTNDRVSIPDANTLDLTTGMTIEAWVKPTVTGSAWKTVLFKHRNSNAQNMVYVMYGNRNTNVPNGEITVGTSVKVTNGPTGSGLPLNVWSHLAATFDNATLRLFVNGNQIASLATAGPIATSTGDLWIGGNNIWNEFFAGVIDEVRVYNRALTAADIQGDMNRAAAPDTDPPAIVAITPADGATGVPVSGTATATFDEAMNPATITSTNFELRNSANALVPASVTYDALTGKATLTPSSPLGFDSSYTVRVKSGATGVKDLAGNQLAADRVWSFLTAPPPPPIAVVSSAGNRFGAYAVEMLKAEGLNEVDAIDVSTLSAAALTGRDVVVLGETALTAAQVTTLTTWVNGGGNLIAFRPDKQLAGLLGITDQAATLAEAYMRIETTPGGPGAGLTGVTMQYHGTADRYALNGATAVATLYSTSATATTNPAVTLRTVNATNGGQAAAFTYDLSRSIVYTRQGNPAWAGQNRDGIGPPRPNDLFFGNMVGDPQPDWLNTQKIGIPQADEQQRLLANLVLRMNRDRKPLPRFWYLPRDEKAAVIMTGDDHADGGTAGRFEQHVAQSAPGCSILDWECVRGTSYIYPDSPLTNAQADAYDAQGFEVALHVTTGCQTNSPSQIDADYRDQMAAFVAKYTNVPRPQTNRTHCVAWSDWSTEPKTELAHGIRLDTNYYHYPETWIGPLPGYMTGSGVIMRFADLDGTTIDTWQAHTHIDDEAGQVYSTHIDYLLDNAIGASGFYGMFTMNMHTDEAVHPGSDAIVASAQARGVPVITAKQALDWVDGRDTSTLTSFTWSANQLSFTLRPGTGARGLRGMLPMSTATANLSAITRDGGTAVPFTVQTIKGLEYAVFDAQNARYTATYTP